MPASPKIEWSKNRGGSMNGYGYASVKTPDGGTVTAGLAPGYDGDVTGQHSNIGVGDLVFIKYDAAGEKQWQKTPGGSQNDVANSVLAVNDHVFYVTGNTGSENGDISSFKGRNDIWTLKIQVK